MVFNSYAFAIFFPIVLILYYSLATRYQNVLLLVASWFFYGWWDYRFLALLGISTIVDYFCATGISRSASPGRRKRLLTVSLATNLGILGFFKYFNFFVGSADAVAKSLGLPVSDMTLHVILPMGISFYTFQTMAYTIDVYRKQIPACRDFLSFALYVSYFPQLVAGPIERASRLLPQFESDRRVTSRHLSQGCFLILFGLFKKVGVADVLAPLVDERFHSPTEFGGAELLFGVYMFAIQIYCDFSGYSDIARGTSKLLGIDLMVNFRQPYFARSITDFWRRWHISLSSWLRDYLYIPLGGNRHGTMATYRNLMITMLLGGLWHGANWTFVIWGGLHGMFLSLNKWFLRPVVTTSPRADESNQKATDQHSSETQRHSSDRSRNEHLGGIAIRMLVTFHLVCLAWIFFRAASFDDAWTVLSRILTTETIVHFTEAPWTSGRLIILLLGLLLIDVAQAVTRDEYALVRLPPMFRGLTYGALVVITLVLGGVDAEVPFIYFQF